MDIAPAEELTHAYFETERWQARPLRRQALASKFFVCHCARCEGEEQASALDASDAALAAADRRNLPHAQAHHHGSSRGDRSVFDGDSWVDRAGFRAEAGAADARRVHEGSDRKQLPKPSLQKLQFTILCCRVFVFCFQVLITTHHQQLPLHLRQFWRDCPLKSSCRTANSTGTSWMPMECAL